MPAARCSKFFFRLEVTGLENIPAAGQRVVLAPNHVSLLDGPLLHTILPRQAAFAVNSQIAQAWWVRPFLQRTSTRTCWSRPSRSPRAPSSTR